MAFCPACNGEMGATEVVCPHCGYDFPDDETIRLSPEQQQVEESTREIDRNIRVGGFFFVGGLLLTAITYFHTVPGDTYILFWGAIVFGGLQMLYGFVKSSIQ